VNAHHESLTARPHRASAPHRHGATEDHAAWAKLSNLQRRILPRVAPSAPGYQQVLAYRPSFVVTGDYHDFFRRADGRSAVFVGDGSGHGPAASMLMAMMRTILHTHPDLHRDAGDTLAGAGRMFHDLVPSDLFMTGIYVTLGEDGEVSWASAGHHPPLRVNRAGEVSSVDLAPIGLVLGIVSDADYPTITWQLAPGERLLLFTDGLWDARDHTGEPFGRQRLINYWSESVREPLHEAVTHLVSQVEAHQEGADFEDDFTVVGIERTA